MSTLTELKEYFYAKDETFNRDEVVTLAGSAGSGDLGPATPDTIPAGMTTGKSYSFNQAGTYTNFLGSDNNPIIIPAPAANQGIVDGKLYYNGTYWINTYTLVTSPGVSIVNDLVTGGSSAALSAEQGKTLSAGQLALKGEKTYNFPLANLVTTTYDYSGTGSPTIAASGESPVQSAVSGLLNVLFKHGPSDLAFLNTGLTIANAVDYNYFKLRFTPTVLANTPCIGLVIGNVATFDWLAILYSQGGGVFGLNALGGVVTIRATDSNYAYVVNDNLTVEYNGNTGIVRTSKNGDYAPDLSVGTKTGAVYIGARGANTVNIKLDLVNQTTPVGFGSNVAQRVSTLSDLTTGTFNGLPLKVYTFLGFNVANLVASGSGVTYALANDGLDMNYAGGSTSTNFITGLGFDNTKSYYSMSVRYKVISLGTNPIIGFGFGTYGTSLHAFGYRQDGSLSFNINNTITNPRAATPALAYAVDDIIGLDFTVDKTAGTVTIRTVLNGVVDTVDWTINPTDFTKSYIYFRGQARVHVSGFINQLQASAASITKNTQFFVSTSGSDTNNGSSALPFKTFAKAIASVIGLPSSKIVIAGGVYRETLNLSALTNENVDIVAQSPDVVQFFGSDQITGWSKTAGRTNVYEAAFTGSIINQSRLGALIYEHGSKSKPITSDEHHPLQKGLTHRLPFTVLVPVVGVLLCDTTPGSYYQDIAGSKIYIHASDDSSPLTNGYTYENIVRAGASSPGFSVSRKANVTLKNLQFLYTTGVRFAGFGFLRRYMCTALASSGSGAFIDDNSFTIAYKDESGFCDGDGTNGHYSSVTGYTDKDQREGLMNGWYTDSWCHDNADDGLSFHERADITVPGGLFEYNGDGGIRQSNDANFRVSNALARGNGWDPTAGTRGSGFDMVNGPSTNRISGSMTLFNCHSENNRNGIGVITGDGTLNAFNCSTRNNTDAEYLVESGVLNAHNCKATNLNPAKVKVATGTGVINVYNDTPLT